METKHMLGKWEVDATGKYAKPCVRKNGIIIALLANNDAGLVRECDRERQQAEDAANAQLIAAAPEMLEALQYAQKLILVARKYFPKGIHHSDTFHLENTNAAIGKAIAKAEGR